MLPGEDRAGAERAAIAGAAKRHDRDCLRRRRPGLPARRGVAGEGDRPGCNQHLGRHHHHADFTARSTALRKPISTPGAARTVASPSVISIAVPAVGRAPQPAPAEARGRAHEACVLPANAPIGRQLPPPGVELIGVHSVAQRHLTRHRTWHQAPASVTPAVLPGIRKKANGPSASSRTMRSTTCFKCPR